MRTARFLVPVAMLTVLVSACEKPANEGGEQPQTSVPAPSAAPMAMHDDTLAARVEADQTELANADAARVNALLPEHRTHLIALLESCRQMMQEMNMNPPGEWTRLDRELRQDLDRMGQMQPQEVMQLMPEHRERVDRVLKMRQDMMKEMM